LSSGEIPKKNISNSSESDKFTLKIHNQPLSSLVGQLALPLQMYPPVYDETNYTENVDIEINCKLSDLDALNNELLKYDLKLVEKRKELMVAIVRTKKN
jgi:hypothetical protein